MKILFLVRSNLGELGGGDRVQIFKTKEALERRGHSVMLSTKFVADMRPYDVVHLFNMQITPHSLLIYLLRAKKYGKPVALSTIYWNPSEWLAHEPPIEPAQRNWAELLYPFKGVNALRVVQAFLASPVWFKWLQTYIKHPQGGQASSYIKRQLLAGVDIILPNGESEAAMVQRDFGPAKASRFVPNGVDDAFAQADPALFKQAYLDTDFVLSVGRIETRKNALALVRAAGELKLPLVMIGNKTVEPAYAARIRALAPDAILIPEMPHEELGSAYQAAKVHALASWFETPGLSSLEAALCGCNIVTTDRGTTKEYFEDMAWYCDPTDYESIKQALGQAFAAPKSDRLRKHILANFSWDKVAEATELGYQQIMKAPRS